MTVQFCVVAIIVAAAFAAAEHTRKVISEDDENQIYNEIGEILDTYGYEDRLDHLLYDDINNLESFKSALSNQLLNEEKSDEAEDIGNERYDPDDNDELNRDSDTEDNGDFLPLEDEFVSRKNKDVKTKLNLRMPRVTINADDTYLCTTIKLDVYEHRDALFIIEYIPHAIQSVAHHMMLFGCETPGSETVGAWDCGGVMHGKRNSNGFVKGPVCRSREQILWAWAKDAPAFKLPKGVGFRVGHGTTTSYLTLQAHFKSKDAANKYGIQRIGVTAVATVQPQPKLAGIYLMATTEGSVAPNTTQNMDIVCRYEGNIAMHPFAFRTHAHGLGKMVYGYRVRDNVWSLIGKKNPQKPEAFYPVANKQLVIRKDDWLAARCVMESHRNRTTHIGDNHTDEMCNFYIMYWTPTSSVRGSLGERVCGNGYSFVHWRNYFKTLPKLAENAIKV